MQEKKTDKFKRFLKPLCLVTLDIIFIALAFLLALLVIFDFRIHDIPVAYFETYMHTIGIWIAICLAVFALLLLYVIMLAFSGVGDLLRIFASYAILGVLMVPFAKIFRVEMPTSYFVFGLLFSFVGTVFVRFFWRLLLSLQTALFKRLHKYSEYERVMIIGAGMAGHMLLREYKESDKIRGKVVCIIDDAIAKKGSRVEGVPVVGNRRDIIAAAKRYNVDKIIFCIPNCDPKDRQDILQICSQIGCKVEKMPGLYQLANGQSIIGNLRKVEPQDLLGRDPVSVNMDEIYAYISDKVVMVTGGGGSIGSELCRQIARSNPKLLLIFDIYENNAYDIQMELKHDYPDLNMEVLIGSVRNTARLDYVLGKYKPEIVFHAAAHKHVPLMEDSPNEAIKNNVFGTYKMAKAAVEYGVKKFVLISTDKAVNPTNIMGASKRLCEMVVQMMNREAPDTDFVAVRFGNVLGSNGSVIPLFTKQIAEGGPVTVTHPDIIRYFMTIPEAVSLVLQAGYYAKGGEIYVLDMGQPVKIADMARNLIRLSGFEPDVDIQIKYTGLRPGEKLFEELLMAEEGLGETENKLIHIGKPIEMDDEKFKEQLKRLEEAYKVEVTNMKDIVAEIVPTYKRNPANT